MTISSELIYILMDYVSAEDIKNILKIKEMNEMIMGSKKLHSRLINILLNKACKEIICITIIYDDCLGAGQPWDCYRFYEYDPSTDLIDFVRNKVIKIFEVDHIYCNIFLPGRYRKDETNDDLESFLFEDDLDDIDVFKKLVTRNYIETHVKIIRGDYVHELMRSVRYKY